MTDGDRIVVGMMYDQRGDRRGAAALEREIELLGEVDLRLQVVVEEYVEPHDLRMARGTPPFDESLKSRAPGLTPGQRDMLERSEVVLALDLPFDVATLAPRLRWVQGMGAGVSQLVSAGLKEADIRLTSAAGVNAVGIGEFVIGRILQHWKRFPELDELQRAHTWSFDTFGIELSGMTVGLIGLGKIASAVARQLSGFDVRVVATRKHWAADDATVPFVDEVLPAARLTEMLGQSDVVVAAVPEAPDTIDMMDAAAFAAMNRGAFFCNVGRGSLVVEEALVDALRTGHLRGAAIDVTRQEPLPPSSPLWDAENLYLSPHAATSPAEFFARLQALFRENVRRYLRDEPLINEVDLAVDW